MKTSLQRDSIRVQIYSQRSKTELEDQNLVIQIDSPMIYNIKI